MSKKPFILGVSGINLTLLEKQLFIKNPVYGFILFKRNIIDKEQLLTLIKDLRNLYDYEILIFVDQEGGRVARLKPPIIDQIYPAASYFTNLYDLQGAKEAGQAVYDNYASLMSSLKEFTINSPCAPVVDLRYSYTDNVIGDRSFGGSVTKVVDLASEAIKAIEEQGGVAIIKHIPGHGRATCDSHYQLPRITNSLEELNNSDFEVFRQLSKNNKIIWAMTTHIIFDALDPDLPVTLSSDAISFIRKEIGFTGTLVSDDICMLALHGEIGKKYSAVNKPLTIFAEQSSITAIDDNNLDELIQLGIIKDKSDQISLEKYLANEFPKVKAEFTASIAKIAGQAIRAGCDLVIHCSSDIDEMTAILS